MLWQEPFVEDKKEVKKSIIPNFQIWSQSEVRTSDIASILNLRATAVAVFSSARIEFVCRFNEILFNSDN